MHFRSRKKISPYLAEAGHLLQLQNILIVSLSVLGFFVGWNSVKVKTVEIEKQMEIRIL
jgi:hypothetical protein